jgi:formyltetrahydrofolate synthetase
VQPVVCLNHFHTDTAEELAVVRRAASAAGARCAVSKHWLAGGEGARELAEAVKEACETESHFNYLYTPQTSHSDRIELIAQKIYGADGVTYSPQAAEKLAAVERDPLAPTLGTCMAKTHLSLSHDPTLKGRPTGWTLPIEDVLVYKGADLVVPVAGAIKLMPGTASDPAFRGIDIDVSTGKVTGLF